MHEFEVQRGRHQCVGRCREDDGILIQQHLHDLVLVILILERAAGVLAHGHAHGAGGTSCAVQQIVILEIDHCDFRALLLTCQQCLFQKNNAVAVLASRRNAHYLEFHNASPFRNHHFSCSVLIAHYFFIIQHIVQKIKRNTAKSEILSNFK